MCTNYWDHNLVEISQLAHRIEPKAVPKAHGWMWNISVSSIGRRALYWPKLFFLSHLPQLE